MSDTQFYVAWLLVGLGGGSMVLCALGIQYHLRKISAALNSVCGEGVVVDFAEGVVDFDEDDELPEPTLGYMCRIDFEEELGRASDGNVVFASPEDCARCRQCTESCGMVEVEVRYVRTVLVGSKFDGTDPLQEEGAEEST